MGFLLMKDQLTLREPTDTDNDQVDAQIIPRSNTGVQNDEN